MKPLSADRSHQANWIHLYMDHSGKIAMGFDHHVERSITFEEQAENDKFRLFVIHLHLMNIKKY